MQKSRAPSPKTTLLAPGGGPEHPMAAQANSQPPRDLLDDLLDAAPVRTLDAESRLVILSDMHLGNGRRNDDCLHNRDRLTAALTGYYLPKGYTLVLNGDIEELLRSRRDDIRQAWADLYRVFGEFRRQGRLVWLRGNHEILPGSHDRPATADGFDGEALRLDWKGRSFLVFHGHQAGLRNSGKYNRWIGLALRLFANPLGIGNRSVAHNSQKRFQVEKLVYDFSRQRGIASIIGHTHRPLFESLSKEEALGYRMEALCREFAGAGPADRERIKDHIGRIKQEYLARPRRRDRHLADTVYGRILTPCLFNSGCCIGKRGFTALEIRKGQLGLVFWSAGGRTVLRREDLDYIFARIELLS